MRFTLMIAAAALFAGPASALSSASSLRTIETSLPQGPSLIVFAEPAVPGFDALKAHVLAYENMYDTRTLNVIVADAGKHMDLARRFGVEGGGIVAFHMGREIGRLSVTASAAEIDALVDRAIPDVFND